MRKNFLTLAGNFILIIMMFFLLNEGVGLTKWINAFFYITAFNMILFLYLLILKGKFFDGFIHSFQRFMKKTESDDSILPSNTVNNATYELFKFNFVTLASLLIVFQVVYFIII